MSELIGWLTAWYNWIFLLPLATGTVFILAELALGSLSDVDIETGLDVDADLDADGDFTHLLSWLGVGQIPITLLTQIFALSFGSAGLIAIAVAHEVGLAGTLFPFTLLGATAAGILATRSLGGLLAGLMPAHASTALTPDAFVGRVGTAASRIDQRSGQIRIDAQNHRPSTVLSGRTGAQNPTAIPRGVQVIITRYDPKERVYTVTTTPTEV